MICRDRKKKRNVELDCHFDLWLIYEGFQSGRLHLLRILCQRCVGHANNVSEFVCAGPASDKPMHLPITVPHGEGIRGQIQGWRLQHSHICAGTVYKTSYCQFIILSKRYSCSSTDKQKYVLIYQRQ